MTESKLRQLRVPVLIAMMVAMQKTKMLHIPSHHSSVCVYQVSISLSCVALDCYLLKIIVWVANLNFLKKILDDLWFEIKTEFSTVSEMFLTYLYQFALGFMCSSRQIMDSYKINGSISS